MHDRESTPDSSLPKQRMKTAKESKQANPPIIPQTIKPHSVGCKQTDLSTQRSSSKLYYISALALGVLSVVWYFSSNVSNNLPTNTLANQPKIPAEKEAVVQNFINSLLFPPANIATFTPATNGTTKKKSLIENNEDHTTAPLCESATPHMEVFHTMTQLCEDMEAKYGPYVSSIPLLYATLTTPPRELIEAAVSSNHSGISSTSSSDVRKRVIITPTASSKSKGGLKIRRQQLEDCGHVECDVETSFQGNVGDIDDDDDEDEDDDEDDGDERLSRLQALHSLATENDIETDYNEMEMEMDDKHSASNSLFASLGAELLFESLERENSDFFKTADLLLDTLPAAQYVQFYVDTRMYYYLSEHLRGVAIPEASNKCPAHEQWAVRSKSDRYSPKEMLEEALPTSLLSQYQTHTLSQLSPGVLSAMTLDDGEDDEIDGDGSGSGGVDVDVDVDVDGRVIPSFPDLESKSYPTACNPAELDQPQGISDPMVEFTLTTPDQTLDWVRSPSLAVAMDEFADVKTIREYYTAQAALRLLQREASSLLRSALADDHLKTSPLPSSSSSSSSSHSPTTGSPVGLAPHPEVAEIHGLSYSRVSSEEVEALMETEENGLMNKIPLPSVSLPQYRRWWPCEEAARLLTKNYCWDAEELHVPEEFVKTPLEQYLGKKKESPTSSSASLSTSTSTPSSNSNSTDIEKQLDVMEKLVSEGISTVEALVRDIRLLLNSFSKWGKKTRANIQLKSKRPEIISERPWYSIAHIRDALRLKIRIERIKDLPKLLHLLLLHGVSIVKFDTEKFICAKEFGWRPISIDMRLPNGLLFELYAAPSDMDKRYIKHVNHGLFENWRQLPIEARWDDIERFESDAFLSQQKYTDALWRWTKRQGFASFSELTKDFYSILNTISVCNVDGKDTQENHNSFPAPFLSTLTETETETETPVVASQSQSTLGSASQSEYQSHVKCDKNSHTDADVDTEDVKKVDIGDVNVDMEVDVVTKVSQTSQSNPVTPPKTRKRNPASQVKYKLCIP